MWQGKSAHTWPNKTASQLHRVCCQIPPEAVVHEQKITKTIKCVIISSLISCFSKWPSVFFVACRGEIADCYYPSQPTFLQPESSYGSPRNNMLLLWSKPSENEWRVYIKKKLKQKQYSSLFSKPLWKIMCSNQTSFQQCSLCLLCVQFVLSVY